MHGSYQSYTKIEELRIEGPQEGLPRSQKENKKDVQRKENRTSNTLTAQLDKDRSDEGGKLYEKAMKITTEKIRKAPIVVQVHPATFSKNLSRHPFEER